MQLATYQSVGVGILYDAVSLCDGTAASQIEEPQTEAALKAKSSLKISPDMLEPAYWQRLGHVVGQASGRGQSLFLDLGDRHWVLRPYRRGGLIAKLSTRRYVWTGLERTRAFREMRLTADLFAAGLPVPRPILGGVTRHGLTYEATLITERLPESIPLADHLMADSADSDLLQRVGRIIRRFHDHGLDHVDLNARNLLIDTNANPWLIDFDRCQLRRQGAWQAKNLERLGRSLAKFCTSPTSANAALMDIQQGYSASTSA
ncbi:3-deoxy-D-manno-octulosonic acid kinase [Halomonas binhaiensis]|uniref:3-deoxy-D-manno-octulosonic acid kinase n=1 Tax=Halomonas binhaiensis TaxID=2562282 RepID=A0A5C1NIV2_9GAMM|nr:3-deoxy-D-manno-octulosonic acid kinase [Halomonas binhaiensis]QEM83642.1 3-deoxy-D-manno-octulosonic acid kinase [Halomonas binhaiensis]